MQLLLSEFITDSLINMMKAIYIFFLFILGQFLILGIESKGMVVATMNFQDGSPHFVFQFQRQDLEEPNITQIYSIFQSFVSFGA